MPRIEDDEDEAEQQRRSISTTREELYSSISTGARLNNDFLLLTFLFTVVASIGLIENSGAQATTNRKPAHSQ
jgi:hypothetical protein